MRGSGQPFDASIEEWFGGIDIYLFDQLQKGRFKPNMRILDAGCGSGRNVMYFLRSGYDVFAVDRDPRAIERVRNIAIDIAPSVAPDRFQVSEIAALPFPPVTFDIVLCIAVLHFASDEDAFRDMCFELMRVLRPSGYLFARLASDIGIVDRVIPLGEGRYTLPDGTDRFLVNESMLLDVTDQIGGTLFEPIKTVNVQGERCMTTWCVEKSP